MRQEKRRDSGEHHHGADRLIQHPALLGIADEIVIIRERTVDLFAQTRNVRVKIVFQIGKSNAVPESKNTGKERSLEKLQRGRAGRRLGLRKLIVRVGKEEETGFQLL